MVVFFFGDFAFFLPEIKKKALSRELIFTQLQPQLLQRTYRHTTRKDTTMSFRRRNIGLYPGTDRTNAPTTPPKPPPTPGIRPSPDDGRPTTSTGTLSLDNLLAGHAGLPLGKTLLIEENGTTDFAGALLRYYASEGVVQDQRVHVVGMPEQWGRSLPGLIGAAEAGEERKTKTDSRGSERMKIAWRYERLGEVSGVAGSRGGLSLS